VTFDPDFEVTTFCDIEYLRKDTIEPWVLYNVNRKSYVLYRTVIFPMTLTDP